MPGKSFIAQLRTRPDKRDEFIALQTELKTLVFAHEPDALVYELFQSEENPDLFQVVATFRDEALAHPVRRTGLGQVAGVQLRDLLLHVGDLLAELRYLAVEFFHPLGGGAVVLARPACEIETDVVAQSPDELDADWSRVRIEQGIGDARYGDQNTDGSRSIRDFYVAFRQAGASAKAMLVSAAAAQWNVPASQCTTSNHEVVHQASGRRLAYGALVPAAAKLPVPAADSLQFKPKTAWRLIGQETSTYDQQDIYTGKAQFGLDVYREGMVYASIEHPPVLGGSVKSVNDAEARAVKGVQQTVTLDTFKPPHLFQPLGGVAVIADNTWAALQGRRRLKVDWNDGAHASFESDAFKKQLLQTVTQPAKVARNLGNVDAEFAKGGKVIEATYFTPLAAHASMEPPAAGAR